MLPVSTLMQLVVLASSSLGGLRLGIPEVPSSRFQTRPQGAQREPVSFPGLMWSCHACLLVYWNRAWWIVRIFGITDNGAGNVRSIVAPASRHDGKPTNFKFTSHLFSTTQCIIVRSWRCYAWIEQ